ncbi:MAG: sensor histidine kinase, partial [Gemmatimonadaceae bacterium]
RRQRELITRLIGSQASLFLGNADGSIGTDFESTTTHAALPNPADTAGVTRIYHRDPDRAAFLAATAPLAGSPWAVMVDVPMNTINAPIAEFFRRTLVIAAIVLFLGLAAAWFTSRRITRPLVQLTEAASAISAGDFSRQVRIDRSDELGQLGNAFGAMAAEVRLTRENLEHRIDERTRDLNATLEQLHDAQESLVRRERLAMLGQLSSGVGHELRNPLGVMTNAVYFLKVVLTTAPAKVHEYLEILQQQITLSEKIVGDLLDFARQKPPRRKATPLREATETQLHKLGRADGISVDIQVPEDLPPVLVDPIQLGQVILNLLTNASQAMDGSGRIHVCATQNGTRVFYDVADTGPGIPAGNLEKIFEPLFTTKARGIGLGLSVSRMLARANGGDLTATSTPGEGARFTLTLEKAEGNS